MIRPIDFVKYGLILWFLCLIVLWVVGLFVFRFVNFSPGITETAKAALEAIKIGLPVP